MAVPTFADLGKKVKDLFKKQYDYKESLKLNTKGSPLSIETDVVTNLGSKTNAQSKITYKDSSFGSVETVLGSDPSKFGVVLTLDKQASGLEIKLKPVEQSMSTTYKTDGLTITGSADTALKLELAAVAKVTDDWVAGLSATVKSGNDLSDYNVGVQYATKTLVASWITNKCASGHTIGWYQKLPSGILGMDVATGKENILRVGGECEFSDDLTLRGKFDSKGILSTAVTHIFAQPKVKAVVSSEFDIFADDIAPKKIGIALTVDV